jgi:hypothetical protein
MPGLHRRLLEKFVEQHFQLSDCSVAGLVGLKSTQERDFDFLE